MIASNNALTYVWRHSKATHGARLVLLALADVAHDDGSSAFPSIATLMRMTQLSHGAVHVALGELIDAHEIFPTGKRKNRTVIYSIPIVQILDDEDRGVVQNLDPDSPDSEIGSPDSGHDPLGPLKKPSSTARSTSTTPTARDHDLDVPDDWNVHEPYWHFDWRRDLSVLCREVGLAGSNKAQIDAASKNAITWAMRRGYGIAAISDALRVAGRVDGRQCTIPWILHADKIDRSIVGDIDEDWLEADPFTT